VTGQDLPRIGTEVPGPRSRALAERLAAVECPEVTFQGPPAPLVWKSGLGANLFDVDDNRFVDLCAGFGAAVLGYAHPRLVAALRTQAGELQHALGDVFPAEIKVRLLEQLSRVLPHGLGHAILSSSGSDAVESALKTALVASGKPAVLAFEGAYHGLGLGALDATWRSEFRRPFLARLAGQTRFVPFGDAEAARRAARAGDVGAILFEPIQGRAGLVFPPHGFLAELRRIADEAGALLVADEVYTGWGRTGRWLACEHEGVTPDVVALGKALGGGLPLSACVGRPEVMERWPRSHGEAIHTSTHLGNPLGCAAALAVMDAIREEGLLERSESLGARWLEQIGKRTSGHPRLRELRGRGLLVALELDDADFARAASQRLLCAGWVVLGEGPDGRTLALTPPLTISESLLERAADALAEALE